MTDEDFDPVIARLQFGELARRLREAAGIGYGEADQGIGGYFGKLSKIENGIIAPRPQDEDWMVERYGVDPERVAEVRRLALLARRRAKPAKNVNSSRQYVSLERRATGIRMVYNEVPGLLQTAEFARAALAASPVVQTADVAGLAEERAARGRRVVRPGGPEIRLVLGEDALHRSNGGPGVLRRQLEHLREVAGMPNVWFRVLARSATTGIVPALSCPFTLLHVEQGGTLAYVESLTRPDYVKAAAPYAVAFDQAWDVAVPERESLGILDRRTRDLADT